VTEKPIDMPHYGLKTYAPHTIAQWYSTYIRDGLDGLKPKIRSDAGAPRVLTADMVDAVISKLAEYPKAPATIIYEMLLEEGAFLKSEVSLPTVRRFLQRNKANIETADREKEKFRFAMGNANDLWQTDLMYGPYVFDTAGRKKPTYLLAYIDDATRLVTYAGFFLTQDITSLRDSFKEAVLRRGIPKALYTDNGKIYRSQIFEYLCANIGVVLLHHAVREASSKGKIERFFRTVRLRFISRLKKEDLVSIDTLNEKFVRWIDDDYQRSPHEGLKGLTPMESFLSQSEKITLVTDLSAFNEKFLIKVTRTVKKDATISVNGELYEANMLLAGTKVDAKYEPEGEDIRELFLFVGDKPVGIARKVNFTDNAKRKRKGRNAAQTIPADACCDDGATTPSKEHTITYSEMKERE
jgi:transposase InsO family protein